MKNKNLNLLIIFFIFLMPFVGSYFYLEYITKNNEHKTTNHGSFIEPMLDLKNIEFKLLNKNNKLFSDFSGKWILFYYQNETCLNKCKNKIFELRQIHIALGKDATKVVRFFFNTTHENEIFYNKLSMKYSDMHIISANSLELKKKLLNRFKKNNKIFLIDPFGNGILVYEIDFNGKMVLKDIKKLLKFSKLK